MSTDATETRSEISIADHIITLPVVGVLALVAGAVGVGIPVWEAFPGMVILLVFSLIGIVITRISPLKLPAVAWVTLVAMIATLPWTPGSAWMLSYLESVDFLALATAVLAYAGLAIERREVQMFKRAGWKFVVIAIFVFIGTFLGSALVAHLVLKIQGII